MDAEPKTESPPEKKDLTEDEKKAIVQAAEVVKERERLGTPNIIAPEGATPENTITIPIPGMILPDPKKEP
jgi:hypothetical protein